MEKPKYRDNSKTCDVTRETTEWLSAIYVNDVSHYQTEHLVEALNQLRSPSRAPDLMALCQEAL